MRNSMDKLLSLFDRLLLTQIFVIAGISKLRAGYAGTGLYMTSAGVSGVLLPFIILMNLAVGWGWL
jgi:putative oxidoreductase